MKKLDRLIQKMYLKNGELKGIRESYPTLSLYRRQKRGYKEKDVPCQFIINIGACNF